ncbi:MAG: hypothetical protein JNK82_06450 [Myxococcaceae bacterium]|nr:hypothetical protein [Myxococcaceae bacterium]
MRRLSGVIAALLLLQACAGPRAMGLSVTGSDNSSRGSGNSSNGSGDSSNDSSNGSNNSSDNSSNGSGQSTGQSNNSSGSSRNTSYHSNNSSQGSRNSSGGSSRDSFNATTDNPNVQNVSLALSGSALLVTTGVAVGLILYFALRKPPDSEPSKLRDEAGPAAEWLRANKRQLAIDLALGAGPALDDLAAAGEVRPENLPRFCQVLAAHRSEILAPLQGLGEVSLETAVRVMTRVGELAVADPALRRDADAFLSRHPGG